MSVEIARIVSTLIDRVNALERAVSTQGDSIDALVEDVEVINRTLDTVEGNDDDDLTDYSKD